MATPTESTKKPNKLIFIIGGAVVLLLGLIVVILLTRQPATTVIDDGAVPLGYAMEAKVMLDQNSLQAAAAEAQKNAREGRIALRYQNDAFSTDGKTFSCSISNAASNLYDMFLTIYADAELTDRIFLSGLVPPGSGFDEITLEHPLEKGDHTVYVALTQVTTDDGGNQAIKNQVMHTIEFHVA